MPQVLSVAKELVKLSLAGEEKDPLTNLRLQKLLYYAQAWSLIVRESELFPDEIEAWRHGPVVPAVYHRLPAQGARLIEADTFAASPDLRPAEAEFVRCIWDAYNPFSALMLSRMTHNEMPWQKTWGDRPKDGTGSDPIQVADLEIFFGRQAIPAPIAAYCHERRLREEEAERKLGQLPPIDPHRLRAAAISVTPAARNVVASGG